MNIIVTTTDQIENRSIESYIGIVRTSAVVGNDVALADLFSSTARKYSRKLEAIYDKALRDIRLQALAVGANAVVGLHGEFEEVFGKGKTRFIVSLMGTAVSLSPSTQNESDIQGGGVSLYDIRRSQLSLMLTRKLENQQTNPSEEDWDNIVQYALFDIAPLLYKRYQVLVSETISSSSPTEKKLLLDNFIPFMRSLDYDSAVNTVYGDTQTAPYVFCDVVKACDLFCQAHHYLATGERQSLLYQRRPEADDGYFRFSGQPARHRPICRRPRWHFLEDGYAAGVRTRPQLGSGTRWALHVPDRGQRCHLQSQRQGHHGTRSGNNSRLQGQNRNIEKLDKQ